MRLGFLLFFLVPAGCGAAGAVADGGTDAAADHWRGCTSSASSASCLPASEYPPCPASFAGGCGGGDAGRVSVGTCGPYTVWAASGKDTTETVYYDGAGNVVAVTNESVVGEVCVAGPADFTPPAACTLEVCDGG